MLNDVSKVWVVFTPFRTTVKFPMLLALGMYKNILNLTLEWFWERVVVNEVLQVPWKVQRSYV